MLSTHIIVGLLCVFVSFVLAADHNNELKENQRVVHLTPIEKSGLVEELIDQCIIPSSGCINPFPDCLCPSGYAMLIDALGSVTCQSLCAKTDGVCASAAAALAPAAGLAICLGEVILMRSGCTLGPIFAGNAALCGTCGATTSVLIFNGAIYCIQPLAATATATCGVAQYSPSCYAVFATGASCTTGTAAPTPALTPLLASACIPLSPICPTTTTACPPTTTACPRPCPPTCIPKPPCPRPWRNDRSRRRGDNYDFDGYDDDGYEYFYEEY